MRDSENEKGKLDRRAFLKSSAVGAATAVSFTGCGSPDEALIPLLVSDEKIPPGVDRWTTSTCTLCPAGCGIRVRSMLGEAKVVHEGKKHRQMVLQVKAIEGNPEHPINRGRICARGQAGPQVLYNPDRVRTPLAVSGARGSGSYRPISWDEATAMLEAKLEPLRSVGGGIAAVAGGSPGRIRLLGEFLAAAGSDRLYAEEAPGLAVLREANRRLFGRPELEVHDIENARYVVAFGANLVESHTSPVRYGLALGHFRQGRAGLRGKLVAVEGRFSLTAAHADEWLPARPGREWLAALAMAHTILQEELYDREAVGKARGFEPFRAWVLERFAPAAVAEEIDVPSKTLIRVARELARHQPGVALAGGAAIAHPNGVLTAAAVQALNVLTGSVGKPGGVRWTAASRPPAAAAPASERYWAEQLSAAAPSIGALIVWGADPLHRAPAAVGLRKALEQIPFIVSLTPFLDDTSAEADLILPDLTYLERWDLVEPEATAGKRVVSIAQPVVRPMYEARDGADVLLGLAAKWGGKFAPIAGEGGFAGFLKRSLGSASALGHGSFAESDAEGFWTKLAERGVWVDDAAERTAAGADLGFLPSLQPPREDEPTDFPLHLQPFVSLALGHGREANVPWLQELPDPMTSIVWGSWIEVHPGTAREFGVADGDVVAVESASGRIELPVLVHRAARPDTVSVPFGSGHRLFGRYASGRGSDPWQILAPRFVRGTGEVAWAATRVRLVPTGKKARVVKLGNDQGHTHEETHR